MIQFGILGPLQVLVGSEPVMLGGPGQRAVLARLLVDPARVVSADALVEDVWNGRPPATAAKIVQKYVSGLRKVFGVESAPILRTSGGGYVLDVDDEGFDAREFEGLVGSRQFTAALALWRGDVLAERRGADACRARR